MAERSDDCSSDQDTDSDLVEDPPLLVGPHRGEDQQSTEQQRSGDTGRQVQGVVTESANSTRLSLVNRYCGFSGPIHIPKVGKVPICILEKSQQHDITRPDNEARPDDKIKLVDNVKSCDNEFRPGKIVRPDEKAPPESMFRPDDKIKPDDKFRPEEKVRLYKARTEDVTVIKIDVEVTTDDTVEPCDRVRPDNEVRLDGIKKADNVRQGDKIRPDSEVGPHHEIRTDEQVRPTPLQSGVNTDSEEDCVLQGDIFEAAQTGDVQTVKNYLDLGFPPELVDEQDWSILHHAASHGQVDVMRLLHSKGCSVNPRDRHGRTPLHHAASSGACASIGVLVEELGSEVNPVDKDGFTPLKWSVQCEQYAAMEDLLRCGGVVEVSSIVNVECLDDETKADVLFQSYDVKREDKAGVTALHLAAREGHQEVVSALVNAGCPINVESHNGRNALHYAAAGGAVEMVSFLVKCGLDVKREDKTGVTALHLAAHKGHQEVVSALVDAGFPIDVEDSDGRNALHFAAAGGVVEIVSFLVNCGLDVKREDTVLGRTALHAAAHEGHQEVVSALVNAGCPIYVEDSNGENALHFAAAGGAVEMVSFLVKCGLDVKREDKTGNTALHLAAHKGHQEVVSALVDAGCPIDVEDSDGRNALHIASSSGAVEMVSFLVNWGLDVKREDKAGNTALHLAAHEGHQEVVSALVNAGCPIDVEDSDGRNALHIASASGAVEMVSFLVNCGLDVKREDKAGDTALHLAAHKGHQEVVSALVNAGCPIDVEGHNGRNALHFASESGAVEMVSFLVNCGLDVRKVYTGGMTALHVAALKGHQEVVSALVDAGCPIDVVDSYGQSALHCAAGAGAIGVMKDLLEGEYNLHVNDETKEGATPLHVACAESQLQAACELVRHGALLTKVAGTYGTPLQQAAKTENPSLIDDLLKSQAMHLFPDNTNPLNVCNSFGQTPAFMAAGGGHITNLERFVANNCDIRVRSNIMFSIFEYAIEAGEIGQLQAIVKACGIDDGCTSQRELLRSLQARDLLDPSKLLILGAIGGGPLVIDSLSSEEDMFTAAAHQVWSDTHCRMFLDYHYRPRKGDKESIYDSLCLPSACPLTPLQIAVICLKYRIEYCEEDKAEITNIAQAREYIQKLITHPVSKPTVNVQFQNGLSPLDVAQQFGLCDIADMIESAGGRPGKWADLPKEHSVGILEVYCSLKILEDANPTAVSRIVEQFFPQLARERILDSKPQLDAVINHVLPNLRCLESWFEVGVQLGVSVDMLTALEERCGSEKRTAYRKMLTLWLQHVCSQVSWKRLFDVLDDFERGRTVKEIKAKVLEELQPLEVSSPPTPSSALMPPPPPSTHRVSLCRPALHRSREAVHPHQRLMDKYRDRFLKVVPAKELALRWYNDQLVSEEVYHEIKPEHVAPSTARNVLFRYFWDHGTPQFFEKAFCQIMVEEGQKGYPQAARLGRDLQEDLETQLSPHH